jgi:hypothetical protein
VMTLRQGGYPLTFFFDAVQVTFSGHGDAEQLDANPCDRRWAISFSRLDAIREGEAQAQPSQLPRLERGSAGASPSRRR